MEYKHHLRLCKSGSRVTWFSQYLLASAHDALTSIQYLLAPLLIPPTKNNVPIIVKRIACKRRFLRGLCVKCITEDWFRHAKNCCSWLLCCALGDLARYWMAMVSNMLEQVAVTSQAVSETKPSTVKGKRWYKISEQLTCCTYVYMLDIKTAYWGWFFVFSQSSICWWKSTHIRCVFAFGTKYLN